MTITATRTTTANPLNRTAEEVAEFTERHSIRGYDIKPSDEARVLDAILSVATSHDTVCQYNENRIYKQLGQADRDDSALNDYIYGVIELCAILAPAALRRVPARVFARATADNGEIQALNGAELEAFMRPIFEESGIGERFESRTGYAVYRKEANVEI